MIDRRLLLKSAGAAALTLASRPALAVGGATPMTLRAAPAKAQIAPVRMTGPTDVWVYNGTTPGPEIRVTAGERVRVRLENSLPQPTAVHWHGIRIDNAMDGAAGLTQEPVGLGDGFDYDFVAPDAGTYWYHTHDRSWEQMARGLYGPLVVEEIEPMATVDRDLTLVLDDWRLTRDGSLDAGSFGALMDWSHGGRLGNTLTVNGGFEPEIAVRAGERVRLRLVNAANARIMAFDLPGHRPVLIAVDGHPVEPRRLEEDAVLLAPAQRADVVVDFADESGATVPFRFLGEQDPFPVATFVYGSEAPLRREVQGGVPALSVTMPHTLHLDDAEEVRLSMTGGAMGSMDRAIVQGRERDFRELVSLRRVWAFNGVAGDMDEPLFRVPVGRTVKVVMENDTMWPHAMHLHGHHFKVLERDGVADPTQDWRDTELVAPRERVTIALDANNPGKWLLHCHMLEHQAGGMITWFEVG